MSEASPEGSKQMLLIGAGVLAFLLLSCCGAGAWQAWDGFVRYGLADDLTELQEDIDESDLDPETKRELVDRIDRLRDNSRNKSIGVF
jgi:hypothetical protein